MLVIAYELQFHTLFPIILDKIVKDPVQALAQMLRTTIDESTAAALMSPNFLVERQQLSNGTFDPNRALRLLRNLQQMVHTDTQFILLSSSEYMFDCPIPGAAGQVGTTLEYVTKNGRIFCAKIGGKDTLSREFEVASTIHTRFRHCPTLLRVVDFISIRKPRQQQEEEEHYALITPFYPRSLACFIGAPAFKHNKLNQFVANVLTCGLASIQALSSCGKCHGDIKYVF